MIKTNQKQKKKWNHDQIHIQILAKSNGSPIDFDQQNLEVEWSNRKTKLVENQKLSRSLEWLKQTRQIHKRKHLTKPKKKEI